MGPTPHLSIWMKKIRCTNLHAGEIVEARKNEYSIKMSRNVVRQLLKRHDYRLRKAQKRQSMKKNIEEKYMGSE